MEQMSLFFNEVEFTEDQFEKQTEEKEEEKTKTKTKIKSHERKKQIDPVQFRTFCLKIQKKRPLFMNYLRKSVFALVATKKCRPSAKIFTNP